MGILDSLTNLNPEQNQGLLAAAAQLLQAGGPSRTPTNFGQALGGGLMAYQQSTEAARKRKLEEERAAQIAQMGAQSLEAGQIDLDGRRRAAQQEELLQGAYGQAGSDPQALIEAVSRIDPKMAFTLRQQLAKATPKFSDKVQTAVGADGQPFQYILAEDGTQKRLDGTLPRDELKLANLGGRDLAYNPFALKEGQSFQRTQTPDSLASNAVAIRGQDLTNQRGIEANQIARGKSDVSNKPLPASALKMQQAELDAIGVASGIQNDLTKVQNQLKTGKLDFGPVSNLLSRARNATGTSNEVSRNFASFQSNMEKLRNDSLRLNAGVQTDGDAQRAWNELFANINDKGVVSQRLEEIKNLNARAVQLRQLNVDGIRANYGKDPLDTEGYKQPAPATQGTSQLARKSVLRGQVIDGYRFKGGDPSQQSNWEKQ